MSWRSLSYDFPNDQICYQKNTDDCSNHALKDICWYHNCAKTSSSFHNIHRQSVHSHHQWINRLFSSLPSKSSDRKHTFIPTYWRCLEGHTRVRASRCSVSRWRGKGRQMHQVTLSTYQVPLHTDIITCIIATNANPTHHLRHGSQPYHAHQLHHSS